MLGWKKFFEQCWGGRSSLRGVGEGGEFFEKCWGGRSSLGDIVEELLE